MTKIAVFSTVAALEAQFKCKLLSLVRALFFELEVVDLLQHAAMPASRSS